MDDDGSRTTFIAKLLQAMQERGYTQSDVARALWGDGEDANGNRAANGRQNVHSWVVGKSLPSPKNLRDLAAFLGVPPETLLPPREVKAFDPKQRSKPVNLDVVFDAVPGAEDRVTVVFKPNGPLMNAMVVAMMGLVPAVPDEVEPEGEH